MAGRRITKLAELRFDRFAVPRVPTVGFTVDDGFRQINPWNPLLRRIHRRELRHALEKLDSHRSLLNVTRHAAVGIAREVEIEIDRGAPLQIAHVDARLAETLHGDQAHHSARPLNAGLVAACAAMAVAPAAAA